MKEQLVLIDEEPVAWRLDDHTRELGRRGVQQARSALMRPLSPVAKDHPGHHRAA